MMSPHLFRQMLLELFGGGQAQPTGPFAGKVDQMPQPPGPFSTMGGGGMPPKITDRMWAGGPTMDMGPGGAPLMPNDSPIMSRGGMVPGASEMPKSTPSLGPLGFGQGPGQSVPMTPPPPQFGPGNMPPGFGMSQAQLPPEMGAMTPGNPGPMGFMPPQGGPMSMGQGGPAPAPAAAPQPPMGQQSAGGALRSLLGGGGRTLYDIFSDTMAGVAAADPTKPGLTAFAQGATGARVSKKAREKESTDAEDKAYEREGTELDRDVKRETFKADKRKWNLDSIMKLIEIAQQRAGGDPNKFRQELIKSSAGSDLGIMDEADLNRAMGLAFPGQNQGSASGGKPKPPNGTRMRGPNGIVTYDAARDAWIDEQGQPVEIPAM